MDLKTFAALATPRIVKEAVTSVGTFHVRTMSSTERDKMTDYLKVNGRNGLRALTAAICLCTPEGVAIASDPFNKATIDEFNNMRADVLEDLLIVAMDLNKIGVTKEDIEADRKNSSKTPPA